MASVMFGIVLLFGIAWQALSPEAVEHARAGLAAKEQGRLPEAIAEFKKVTALEPRFAAAFVNLGAAYMDHHEYAAAIAPLKRAVELNPELVGAHQMLGFALLSQGYAAEAIPHFERAGVEDGLGIAQLKTGKLTEAVSHLTAALAKRPGDPDLLYYLGRASGLLSKEVFDTLESSHPESARAHQALAENYSVLRQVPEAEKEYSEALRLRPETPGLHLALGQLYATSSQWPRAEAEFRAEARLEPGDAETAYRLGAALLEEGQVQEAFAELRRADQLRPEMPETLYSLGKAASLSGDVQAAEAAWEKVIVIDKESSLAAQAHFGLANLFRKRGRTKEAEAEMQEFRRLQNRAPIP